MRVELYGCQGNVKNKCVQHYYKVMKVMKVTVGLLDIIFARTSLSRRALQNISENKCFFFNGNSSVGK